MRAVAVLFLSCLALLGFDRPARAGDSRMTIDDALAIALRRNREVVALRLEVEAAEVDRMAAGLHPNPTLSYTVGNVVLGAGNPQDKGVQPAPFSQLAHTIGVSQVIDVWAKRSARMRAGDRGIERRRLLVEDGLREISYAVRTAFVSAVREQLEADALRAMKARYDETIRISGARFRAGDISEAEFRKIELEGLKYQNALIDAELELDLARQNLAALMGLDAGLPLPATPVMPNATRSAPVLPVLVARALEHRPDLRAARHGRVLTDAMGTAARREPYPDIALGVAFTHSEFQVSGDNPNALALTVSLPIPLFDRNQPNVARAELDARRFDNEAARLALEIQHEVAAAVRRVERASKLLDVYEDGGMLDRANKALRVAESSYQAGAISLIELLEAQRTFVETKNHYLRAQGEHQQALVDVAHATGGNTP